MEEVKELTMEVDTVLEEVAVHKEGATTPTSPTTRRSLSKRPWLIMFSPLDWKKQASDYSMITQFIINHVRKMFEF